MIHIGIFIGAYKNKKCYDEFSIGYAGFFNVRKEIAKLTGFEYGYEKLTNIPNHHFNKNKPEDRLDNPRYIPDILSNLQLKIPEDDETKFTKLQIRNMKNFLCKPDVEARVNRSEIKSLFEMLQNKDCKNPNCEINFNNFKSLLTEAYIKDYYIKWE